MIEELERRGYACNEVTRAMAMPLEDLVVPAPSLDVREPSWPEYQEFLQLVDVPPGLLSGVDTAKLDVVMARLDGTDVAAGLSFDHDGDCGIFNVATRSFGRAAAASAPRSRHICSAPHDGAGARRQACSRQPWPSAFAALSASGTSAGSSSTSRDPQSRKRAEPGMTGRAAADPRAPPGPVGGR